MPIWLDGLTDSVWTDMITVAPAFWLAMAAGLNVSIWISHYIKLSKAVRNHIPGSNVTVLPLKMVHGITVAYMIVLCISFICFVFYADLFYQMESEHEKHTKDTAHGMLFYGMGGVMCIASILFLVTGIAINNRLSIHFNKFYRENRIKLCISTFGLSVPLLLRGVVDIMRATPIIN